VAPDKPTPGAGRIETPDAIDRYLFTVAPGTALALKPESPCTFGHYAGSWELRGPSQTIGGNALCGGDERMVLQNGGTYGLTFSPGETGEYAFVLVQLTDDVQSYTLNIGDHVAPDKPGPGAGRIEMPGSLDRYTFTAEAGTRVAVKAEPPCNDKFFSSIDDTNYWSILNCSTTRYFSMKRTGTHTVTVKGDNGGTGDYGFILKLPGR